MEREGEKAETVKVTQPDRLRHRNGDGQPDRNKAQECRSKKADRLDNKRVYQHIK